MSVSMLPVADQAAAVLQREPAEAYRAQAGPYLTSHLLADFRKCPLLYQRRKLGLVPDEDRPAYVIGRAAHTLILEGEQRFAEEFVVGGPVNPRTGLPFGQRSKATAAWTAEHGKTALSVEQCALIRRMRDNVQAHSFARELLSEGVAEAVVRADYCGVPCQIRMDWFDPHCGIVDLKTIDNLDWFEPDARRYGYLHQIAFYRHVLAQVISLHMPVAFIAVEKKEPFRCGVWKINAEALAEARRENEAAIDRLKVCQARDLWPSGYEECRVFEFLR